MSELTDEQRARIHSEITKILKAEGVLNFILYYDTLECCTYTSSTLHTATKFGMIHMLKRIVEKSDDESNKERRE